MPNVCNVDGVVTPEAEAVVPVLDRGFLFGDSVYEVLRTRGGVPFAWREHLERLHASAEAIGLDVPLADDALMHRVLETMTAGAFDESYVRIIVTRGTGTAPNIDLSHAPGPSRVVLMVRDMPRIQGRPARVAVVERLRLDRRALDPAVKSGNYLNNVLGLAEAQAAGATDCLFLNHEGQVTEASTSNVFMIRGDTLVTPPLRAGLLAGITRRLLFRFAEGSGMAVEEAVFDRDELEAADELFLSSTLRDVSPITHVDGRELHAGGGGGPRTLDLVERFGAWCDRKAAEEDAPPLGLPRG